MSKKMVRRHFLLSGERISRDFFNHSSLTSDYVQPICLPFADEEEEAYTSLTSQKIETVVAGWGATEQLGTYDLVYA